MKNPGRDLETSPHFRLEALTSPYLPGRAALMTSLSELETRYWSLIARRRALDAWEEARRAYNTAQEALAFVLLGRTTPSPSTARGNQQTPPADGILEGLTFTTSPILGGGYYLLGDSIALPAEARPTTSGTAADAVGTWQGTPGQIDCRYGVPREIRLRPGLATPIGGTPFFTAWESPAFAGMFTTSAPSPGSNCYLAFRGRIVRGANYDAADPAGSRVLALWQPRLLQGPL